MRIAGCGLGVIRKIGPERRFNLFGTTDFFGFSLEVCASPLKW
jgi:hypothetical protein